MAGRLKGVLLAGGTGSRLAPLTTITNKHLLPVHDRPMVALAIEALVGAGVDDVMLVTGGTHAGEFLRLLGSGQDHGLERLTYAYQERPGGIAEALGLAQRFAGGDPVVVMLADNVFEHSIAPFVANFAARPEGGRLLLAEVGDPAHLRHLGVAAFDGDGALREVVEKPAEPPSGLAVTGVYAYEASVFEVVRSLVPSARGELEIADVNNHYIRDGSMGFDVVSGFWGDAGESIDAYHGVNDFVRTHGANKG